jgi:WD40 repeat protein
VTLWRDLSKVATLDATFGSVSPDGQVLVTTSKGPSFDVWNLTGERPALVRTIKYANEAAARPVFSPDGRLLAIRTADAITVWTTDDMREAFQLQQPSRARISAPAFSPDGTWIAASAVGDVVFWRLADRSRHVVKAHQAPVNAMAFSPGGFVFATGSIDRTVRLWRVSDFQMLGEMRADARTIVAGTQDGLVQLWNTATRREIASWKAHTTVVSGLAFSRGDTVLATVSVDHEMRLWTAPALAEADRR